MFSRNFYETDVRFAADPEQKLLMQSECSAIFRNSYLVVLGTNLYQFSSLFIKYQMFVSEEILRKIGKARNSKNWFDH